MKLSVAMIDAMLASGCSHEQVVGTVRAMLTEDDESLAHRRDLARDRQRRKRELSRTVTPVTRDTALPPNKEIPHTPLEIKPLDPPIVPPSGDGLDRRVRKANEHDAETYSEFEEAVWAEFPRHPNSRKHPAYVAYEKLPLELRAKCIGGVMRYAARFKATDDKGRSEAERLKFVPHLTTWIHQRGWESEYDRQG